MALDPELVQAVNALPPSWGPRRNQPNGDHMFSGRLEIQHSFSVGDDRAVQWCNEAVAFSETLKYGFGDGGDDGLTLADFGLTARAFIAKGKDQGLDK